MVQDSHLSGSDVTQLLQDPSAENRAIAAAKVSAQFGSGELSDQERRIAEEIFRAMVKDVEVRVRHALSESLADNPKVPHEVAKALANDVAEVAMPMIETSIVLTDADLIEIIESRSSDVQQAVARRGTVTESVADALVSTNNEDVVAALVANEGADISEGTMGRVLDDFGDSVKVNAPMAQRSKLPIGVAERLVTLVSDKFRNHIVTHHELSPDVAADLLLECRERATVSLLEPGTDPPDVLALVDQLMNNGRLSPTIIMRAICMGDVTFFEAALARLADIPIANAYKLVHDKGTLGLRELFKKASMPSGMLPVANAALSVATEMSVTSGDDRERFKQIMIERVLTACEDDFDGENLDYFISKLGSVGQANKAA